MGIAKSYRPWTPDQPFLLPPNPGDWLPAGHLVHFVLEIVGELDLSNIEAVLQAKDSRGERSYDPRMMTSLLVCGYCTGVFSSRKIERKTHEDLAFRYLAGGDHPDFSTLCTFRRTHLIAFQDLVAAGTADEAEQARALARAARREDAANALEPATTVDVAAGDASDGPDTDDDVGEPAGDGSELPRHRPKVTRAGRPKPTAQRNFTDPDSRIMDRGGQITQAYNGQIAVDSENQVIVAQGLSNQAPDTHYFVPMLERVRDTTGALPAVSTADAGYWSPENAAWADANGVDAYIATQRHRRSAPPDAPRAAPGPAATPQERMRHKVGTPEGQKIYRRRKCIPEPVFGQIKQAMGSRRFSLRGMGKVQGEWALVCMSHNVRKLWSAGIAEA